MHGRGLIYQAGHGLVELLVLELAEQLAELSGMVDLSRGGDAAEERRKEGSRFPWGWISLGRLLTWLR